MSEGLTDRANSGLLEAVGRGSSGVPMQTIELFWKPILLSAVLCHVASALLWMVLPIHKNDFKNPGDKEKTLMDFVRTVGLPPGMYWVPYCGPGTDRKNPEVMEKLKNGPYASFIIMPKAPSMGASLGMWIVNLLLISFAIAYIAGSAGMMPGATYMQAFKVCGLIALLAHAGNALTLSIWMGLPWSQLPGRIVDAVVYASLTAGTFAWLWPKA